MGLDAARRGAGWMACALVERCHQKNAISRFDRVPCMWIALAMRDRAPDVTTTSADVSNRVMYTAWCDHAWESRHITASAVMDTQEARNTAQAIGKASL